MDLENNKDKSRKFTYTPEDFQILHPFLTSIELNYCTFYLVSCADIFFSEYNPNLFCKIRHFLGHRNCDIFRSVNTQINISFKQTKHLENPKNSSLIYFTTDQNYVIKTISKQEKVVFLKFLLERYAKRIFECPESKFARILGVFKIISSKIYFILMENTAPVGATCQVFDLKGSKVDRLVENVTESGAEEFQVLKDENFRVLEKKIKIRQKKSEKIIKILKEDMKILRDIGIMDYSLLLVMSEQVLPRSRYSIGKHYYISIIDIFQIYDNFKGIERWYKIYIRRVEKNLISVVSPTNYFNRLLDFVKLLFIDKEEDLELSFNF